MNGVDSSVRDAWNSMAKTAGLSPIRLMNAARTASLQLRIKEAGLDGVMDAIAEVGRSAFLRGQNKRGWQANFDFVLQPSSFVKLIEGHYRDRPQPREKFRNGALEILYREAEAAARNTITLEAQRLPNAPLTLLYGGDD